MERSKGVSTQQTLQCQCIGGLQKYLKADVWVSFIFSKTIWIAFWESFTFSKNMWTNVNMFSLFTLFNYETVPVYCLCSTSTACLILVKKSKVLDAAAAQTWFLEYQQFNQGLNYTRWSPFRFFFLLVANAAMSRTVHFTFQDFISWCSMWAS